MDFTDFAQLTDWFSQAAIWCCGLLITLLSGLSLLGCLVCLGGTIAQTLLELRHQRRYQTLASPLALRATSVDEATMTAIPPPPAHSFRVPRAAQF